MATSGTTLNTITARQIIQEALELVGALGEGETANADQETSLLRTLQSMCIMWQADGLNLFAVSQWYIFMQKKKQVFRIPGVTDDWLTSTIMTEDYTPLTLAEEAAVDDTVVVFTEAVPEHYDSIGLLRADGYMEWYTVDVNNGTDITLTAPLVNDFVDGTKCYAAVAINQEKPMKVIGGSLHYHNSTSIPMDKISREEYERLSRKDSMGVPLQFYEDIQPTYADLYFWPTASDSTMIASMHVQRQLDTAFSVTQDVEYPAEWFMPLAENLAYRVSRKYGLPRHDTLELKQQAATSYEMARNFDFEWGTSSYFQPDCRG